MNDLLHNPILWKVILVMVIVQVIKFVWHILKKRKVDFRVLFRTGGMPSSHTASVMALSTLVGRHEGFDSSLFAVTMFFSLIVMYDAAGVRRAAGKQAAVINKIIDELKIEHKVGTKRLAELLGHTPVEVLVGAILGIGLALIMD